MTTLSERFKEAVKANNNDDYTTISVRESQELAAMVEAMSIATQQPVVNMFTTDISRYLADYLLEDKKNMELIKQVITAEHENKGSRITQLVINSSIEILSNEGCLDLKIKFDTSDLKKVIEKDAVLEISANTQLDEGDNSPSNEE